MNSFRFGNRTPPLLALVAFLLVLLVVLLSAYTRLRQAGLSCVDWPACYGVLGASAAPAWTAVPHRLAATLLGLVIFAMAYLAWRCRRTEGGAAIPLALLVLTLLLAALGLVTPASTRPWVTLANLLGGMGMLALLWRLVAPRAPAAVGRARHHGRRRADRARGLGEAVRVGGAVRIAGLVLLGVLFGQAALGAGLVLFDLPLWMAVAHNAGAAALLIAAVYL